MGYINKPPTLAIGGSVSASHIRYVYESLTGGKNTISISGLNADTICDSSIASTAYSWSFLNLKQDTRPSFSVDPIDRTNGHINTVMEQFSLSAIAANEGKIANVTWRWGVSPNPVYEGSIFTACMRYGDDVFKWVFNEELYTEWEVTNVIN